MLICYGSDFHVEIRGQEPILAPDYCDVLILAGDIGNNVEGLVYSIRRFKARCKHLIYVAGNHEFYRHVYEEIQYKLKVEADKHNNVHVLDNDSVEIDGITFIGATMWTDFEMPPLSKEENMEYGRRALVDHRLMFVEGEDSTPVRVTPEWMIDQNQKSKAYIFDTIEKVGRDKSVVITHHGPATGSLHPKYYGSTINGSFNSPWDDLLIEKGPAKWVHGHVHDRFDYVLGMTNVLVNPRGYPRENPGEYEFGEFEIAATVEDPGE